MSQPQHPSATAAINRILMAALAPGAQADVLGLALGEALDLTASSAAWLGEVAPGGRVSTLAHVVPEGADSSSLACGLPGPAVKALLEQLDDDRAMAFQDNGLELEASPEHPDLGRLLVARVPTSHDAQALVVVCGRDSPYGAREGRRLTKLAPVLGQLLAASRTWTDQAMVRATFDGCPDGLALCDLTGAITMANAAFVSLWGREQESDLVGWSVFELCIRREAHASEARLALAQGQPWQLEATCSPQAGGPIPLVVHAGPVFDPLGRLAGAAISVRDARRARAMEDRLWRTAQELARSNRELEGFAVTAAHELRDPLRKILAFGEFLQADCGHRLDATGRDYLARMLSAAERQRELVDGLLRFARVQGTAPSLTRVKLGQVARDVIGDLREQLSETSGSVQLEHLPTIHCDQVLVRQLLHNLVENAIKFRRPGRPPVVRISARSEGGWCEIMVRDEGIGFDNARVHSMFQVFGRLHGRREFGGTGLGLPICQRIAEIHGGTVSASSPPEGGALFAVSLPVEPKRTPAKP